MKAKKILSVLLISSFLVGSIASSASALSGQITIRFNDISEAKWAIKQISKMACKNVVKGYAGGYFKPNKPVTHAEAVVLAMKAAGYGDDIKETVEQSVYLPYNDAKSIPAWAKPAITLAESKGFIPSETSVNFQPNKPASREWVTELIVNAYGYKDKAKEKTDVELPFTDVSAIAPDAIGYIAIALEENIISGMPNGSFQPNKPVTRAEIAVMLGLADSEISIPVQKHTKCRGIISDIDIDNSSDGYQGTVTIKNDNDEKTYQVDKNAQIYLNDKLATLEDLTVGSKADLVLDSNNVVVFIEVEPTTVRGILKRIDGNKIVVNAVYNGRNTSSVEYIVNNGAKIVLNGKITTLNNLKPGALLKITLSADKSVETVKATFLPKSVKKHIEKKIIKEVMKNTKNENKKETKKVVIKKTTKRVVYKNKK